MENSAGVCVHLVAGPPIDGPAIIGPPVDAGAFLVEGAEEADEAAGRLVPGITRTAAKALPDVMEDTMKETGELIENLHDFGEMLGTETHDLLTPPDPSTWQALVDTAGTLPLNNVDPTEAGLPVSTPVAVGVVLSMGAAIVSMAIKKWF